MYANYGLFIDGAWRPADCGDTVEVIDPATMQTLGVVPSAGVEDTEAAIAAASAALKTWRTTPAWTRADMLHAIADVMRDRTEEAVRIVTLETGKPLAQSRREWGLSVDQFRWYAEEARRIYGRIVESRAPGGRIEVTHGPVGVVASFTAGNFPAFLVARKIAPALAAGCTVVARPSIETPGTAMLMVECIRQAGRAQGRREPRRRADRDDLRAR